MVYDIVFRERSRYDLKKIFEYIAQDSPQAAADWMNYLEESTRSLADKPDRIRPHEGKHRHLVLKRGYGIYYWISEASKTVYVTRIYGKGQLRGK